jgi:hydroxymethylpyrimidine/phosphomethylpyrimidine kinase
MNQSIAPPVVIVFSGLDPTGGAGLQADIETLASTGCHAAPIATCLTIQTTQNVQDVIPVDSTLIIKQARAILEDMPVKAFKLGLLGAIETGEAIAALLNDYADIPVILDPIINAGGGSELANAQIVAALGCLLIPKTTLLTPNSEEAHILAPNANTLDNCAMTLLADGCEYILITGTHSPTQKVINSLYGNHRKLKDYRWERLDENFHGSGCTLASALAGFLAHGHELYSAVLSAQRYTWRSLSSGYYLGMGQALPNRLFWSNQDKEPLLSE